MCNINTFRRSILFFAIITIPTSSYQVEKCDSLLKCSSTELCSDSGYGNVCVDNSCDEELTRCSAGPRVDGDNHFPCKIHIAKNCTSGLEVLPRNANVKNIKSPLLKVIRTYPRTSSSCNSSGPYPALNLSFSLPYGHELATKTTGIQLQFRSQCDSGLGIPDCYYYKHPVFRVFDFRNAMLGSYDVKNPRVINYGCLIGIQKQDGTYYDITLTAFPYLLTITYRVTVFDMKREWITTMAVAVFPGTQDVHVVFQQSERTDYGYDVILKTEAGKVVSNERLDAQSNDYTFKDVQPDYYRIKIRLIGSDCKTKDCNVVISSIFEVVAVDRPEENTVDVVLAGVLGCLGGVALLCVLLLVILYKKQPEPKEVPRLRVLLLYQYVCEAHYKVVLSLEAVMTDLLKCKVTIPEKHLADIHKSGNVHTWLNQQLKDSKHDKIVILYPKTRECQNCSEKSQECNNNTVVKDFLAVAENLICKKSDTLQRVIKVYFDYSLSDSASSHLHVESEIHLMKDIRKLYKILYSIQSVNLLKNKMKEYISFTKYNQIDAGKKLEENIKNAVDEMSCKCDNRIYGLITKNNAKNDRYPTVEYSQINYSEPKMENERSIPESDMLPRNQTITSAEVQANQSNGQGNLVTTTGGLKDERPPVRISVDSKIMNRSKPTFNGWPAGLFVTPNQPNCDQIQVPDFHVKHGNGACQVNGPSSPSFLRLSPEFYGPVAEQNTEDCNTYFYQPPFSDGHAQQYTTPSHHHHISHTPNIHSFSPEFASGNVQNNPSAQSLGPSSERPLLSRNVKCWHRIGTPLHPDGSLLQDASFPIRRQHSQPHAQHLDYRHEEKRFSLPDCKRYEFQPKEYKGDRGHEDIWPGQFTSPGHMYNISDNDANSFTGEFKPPEELRNSTEDINILMDQVEEINQKSTLMDQVDETNPKSTLMDEVDEVNQKFKTDG